MRGAARRTAAIAALTVVIGVPAGVAHAVSGAGPAEADFITGFDVQATVLPDGSMEVVERLDITLVDPCNGAYRTIPEGDYEVTDLAVSEDGEAREFASTDLDDIRWYAAADQEPECGPQAFELSYTVEGAVDVAPDVGDLYWQFVGTDFPPVDAVSVEVTFPGDGTGLRAWGHGSLHGVVDIRRNTVSMTVDDNPSGSMVELRAVSPASDYTAPPSGEPVLDGIVAEEEALAEEANRQRRDELQQVMDGLAREVDEGVPGECDDATGELAGECDELAALIDEAEPLLGGPPVPEADELRGDISTTRRGVELEIEDQRVERWRRAAPLATAGFVAACVGAFALIWRRWGRNPQVDGDEVGRYWREVPEQSPAVVAAFRKWGKVDARAFTVTVVDLAQRGFLTIARDGGDIRFTKGERTSGTTEARRELKDYELKVLYRLFATRGRTTVSQRELTEEASAGRASAARFMEGFKAAVTADYESGGFDVPRSRLARGLAFGLVGLLATWGFAVMAITQQGSVAGLAPLAAAVVVGLLTRRLRQRTPRGARLAAELRGLRRHLRDFSVVDEVPVGHLALYERYLVYAVALGVADQLAAALRVRFPDLTEPGTGFAPWIAAGSVGGGAAPAGGFESLGGFASGLSSATASAFSPPSSSAGGGGGFSGGGGGGSGGGGGGGGGAGGW